MMVITCWTRMVAFAFFTEYNYITLFTNWGWLNQLRACDSDHNFVLDTEPV